MRKYNDKTQGLCECVQCIVCHVLIVHAAQKLFMTHVADNTNIKVDVNVNVKLR